VLDAGRVAAIRDPTGAIVSLWQPRSRIGATVVNDTGALCWNELATTDVERARSFFGELLGWEYETDDSGYVSVKNAGTLNGGMREQTEHERHAPPAWLPYFTVESADEASRRGARLGGRGLLPTTEGHRGRYAVIPDHPSDREILHGIGRGTSDPPVLQTPADRPTVIRSRVRTRGPTGVGSGAAGGG
jgi:predicted enzyme related to lactoylglutathione lyase